MIEVPTELIEFAKFPKDYPRYDENNPDYRCSVEYDKSNYRINIAKIEACKETVDLSELLIYIKEFLAKFNIFYNCILFDEIDVLKILNYEYIKRQYMLNNQSDSIWLRFTKDDYLGTIASSNDINFEYSHNSGKIIKAIGKEWNENRIIVIPLQGI